MLGDSDAGRDDLEQLETVGRDEPEEPQAPVPPVTGDATVDDAMTQLARSQSGSFAERIEAGEHANRSLQSRLGGLGGA